MNRQPSIESVLANLGFPKPHNVQGRGSIADLFRKQRCGIYVLHFADGAHYVGQAVDVVRRYAQHRQTHRDIQQISFKKVSRKNLNTEERSTVHVMENSGFHLRNIQIVSFSYGETDFDLVMSPSEQKRWLEDLSIRDINGDRVVDERLRSLYTRKYQTFRQMPHAPEVTSVLREYVQTCIPAVKQTEISFWMCSCILRSEHGAQFYSRINVGFQTTLQAYSIDNQIFFGWFITKGLVKNSIRYLDQTIRRMFFQSFQRLFHKNGRLSVGKAGLIHGGQDQVYLELEGSDNALKLLQNQETIRGFRQFNLGLMQKGPCPWGRNHCMDLADQLIGGEGHADPPHHH